MISKSALNFNKEILFGEVGALAGAPTTGWIVSQFTQTSDYISLSAVLGSILGAAIFWLSMKMYDEKINKHLSVREMAEDIAFFTPAAFILTILVYYPSLFFISRYFISNNTEVFYSVVFSQAVAFTLFLITINIYRYALLKIVGKSL